MATHVPKVGKWYQDVADDEVFEVVAVDARTGTIEVQYLEGELSELDPETWQQMILLPAEPPEDWRASYEMSMEDCYDSDDIFIPDSADDPLSYIEPDSFYGFDDLI